MNYADLVLLGILTAVSFLTVPLRAILAKKQGRPQSLLWTVQSLIFPVLLLIALLLLGTGRAEAVFPLVALALIEELVAGILRRRQRSRDQ